MEAGIEAKKLLQVFAPIFTDAVVGDCPDSESVTGKVTEVVVEVVVADVVTLVAGAAVVNVTDAKTGDDFSTGSSASVFGSGKVAPLLALLVDAGVVDDTVVVVVPSARAVVIAIRWIFIGTPV